MRASSPSPSMRSTRSFLDDDPYPSHGSSSLGRATSPLLQNNNSNPGMTPSDLLAQLERLLANKANEIQLAGRLGEALLGQQAELEARIREVAEVQQTFAAASPAGQRRAAREASGDAGLGGGTESEEEGSEGEKEVGAETKKKLAALEEDMKRWDEGNNGLYEVVGNAAARGVPTLLSSSIDADGVERPESPPLRSFPGPPPDSAPHARRPSAPMPPSANLTQSLAPSSAAQPLETAASSRRARNNAQHRTNDIELATEIGQSLLGEVRRLQALLVEKDEQLRDGQEARDALERELENEALLRRSVEDNVEKFKEENWNLELASQEMRTALADANGSVLKADSDRQRVAKELASTREVLDTHRLEAERLAGDLELLKARHETDMANMRKQTAGLQRERSDLQGSLEGLKTELATHARGIRRIGSNQTGHTINGLDDVLDEDEDEREEDDVFRVGGIGGRRKTGDGFLPPPSPSDIFDSYGESPDNSPVQRPGSTAGEEARSSLAHAQRTIATLRASLAKEKAAKLELRRQLADGGGSPDASWEEEEEPSSRDVTPARSMRGSARRGTARRRGGGGLPSRLGRELTGAGDTSIDEEEDEEVVDSFGPGETGSIFEHHFVDEDGGSEEGFDSPLRNPNRASVASVDMDPDYANVLDRDGSDNDSLQSHGGSLRTGGTTLAAALGHRRPTSISSVQSGRPTSAMFSSGVGHREVVEEPAPIVWVDESTMTDFVERSPTPLPPAPVYVPPPPPQVTHVGVQITPEPVTVYVPPLPPQVADAAVQITPEPVVVPLPVPIPAYAPPPPPEVAHVGVQVTPEPVVVPLPVPVPAYVPPPPPEVAHFGVQVTPEPIAVVAKADFTAQTEPEVKVKVETKETGIATDAPAVGVEAGVGTDAQVAAPAAVAPKGIEMESQTDAVSDEVTLLLPPLPGQAALSSAGMEDRALANRASFGDLNTPKGSPFLSQDLTLTAVPQDYFEADTDTESDAGNGEFEDARESIGVVSPSPSTISGGASLHDMYEAETPPKAGADSGDESDMEVLRNTVVSRPAANGFEPKSVEVTEAGVQTDEWKPVTQQVKEVVTPPATVPRTVYLTKRDSINTFGRPDSGEFSLAASAALAGAYAAGTPVDDRAFSPSGTDRAFSPDERPESVSSLFSLQTDDASIPPQSALDKGKGKAPEVITSMAPPTRIPLKQPKASPRKSEASTISNASTRGPGRPTSPPPPDLLYRAQSPSFDQEYERKSNGLLAPGSANRGSMPPPRSSARGQNLRPQASTLTEASGGRGKTSVTRSAHVGRRGSSVVSLSDSVHSDVSRRMSVASSRTSEGGFDSPMRTGGDSTDPAVIHAITQTMIGEFLYKYTRRTIGKGISEKRHKRFFWVHPYTKTLYWSSSDPGAQNTNQSSSKSVFIEGVRQVLDPNPFPPGLHQGSIIVKTPNREMKITASTRERHDMWFQAINYLLARPDVPTGSPTSAQSAPQEATPTTTPGRGFRQRMQSEGNWETPTNRPSAKGMYTHASASDSRLTPQGQQRAAKLSTPSTCGKRTNTAAAEFERSAAFGSPRSLRTFSDFLGGNESVEFVDRREIPEDLGPEDDETWEGLENVRACCDGKHDVGSLSRGHRHHHHNHSASDLDAITDPTTPNRTRSKSSLGTYGGGSLGSRTFNSVRRIPIPSPRKAAPTTGVWTAPLGTNTNTTNGTLRSKASR